MIRHLLAAGILTLLLLPASTHAQSQNFTIDRFHADVTIREDATLHVKETIQGEFLVPKHGIIRDIPFRYSQDPDTDLIYDLTILNVEDGEGNPVPFEPSEYLDEVSLRIGNPYATIEGPYTFVISYTMSAPFLYLEEHDELFWNVTGTAWDVPISRASATVTLPEGATSVGATCYTGIHESEAQDCTWSEEVAGTLEFTGNDYLTIVAGFEKGYIPVVQPEIVDLAAARAASEARRQAYIDQRNEKQRQSGFFILIPLLALGSSALIWLRRGKDRAPFQTIVAEYAPYENLRPAELATLADNKLHTRDLSASIVDLAVRGHIKIKETGKRSYTLIRRNPSKDSLKKWEQDLLKTLFKDKTSVKSRSLSYRLGSAQHRIRKEIKQSLFDDGFYTRPMGSGSGILVTLGILSLAIGIPAGIALADEFYSLIPLIAIPLSAAPLFFTATKLNQRTLRGVEAARHAQGFKEFLYTAERYRLKWQEDEGMFERFLPYAMAFGVADKWSKAFEDLFRERDETMNTPSWYSGMSGAVFNPVTFNRHMKSFAKATAPRASSSSSSYRGPSSSGFSSGSSGGGGFSGGGFGGGGGSSW